MKIKTSNIVILGFWNKKIFTPDWVLKNIYEISDDTEVKIAFNLEEQKCLYEYDDVRFVPDDNRIQIVPLVISEENLDKVNTFLIRLLKLLPHSPIKGIGFNFHYHIIDDISQLIEKTQEFANLKFNLDSLDLIKFKIKNKNYVTNLFLDNLSGNKEIKFNFHYDHIQEFDTKQYATHFNESIKLIGKIGNVSNTNESDE